MSNVDKKSVDGQLPVRLCNYTDVYYGDRITPELDLMRATATQDQIEAFRLRPGDVVITKDSEDAADIGVPAFVADSSPDLVCGYHLAVLRPAGDRTDGRFLYWAMGSAPVQDHLSVSATGITRYGLRTESIAATPVPWWPIETQRAIAHFLDAETARIDALIAKKRRLIELLESRLQALIDHTVGYDVSSWPKVRLRWCSRRIVDGTHGTYERVDSGRPLLSAKNLRGGVVRITEQESLISETDYRSIVSSRQFLPGDILLGVIGGSIGNVARLRLGDPLAFQRSVAAISPAHNYDGDFLAFVTRSTQFRDQLRLAANTSAQAGVYLGDLGDLRVPLAPVDRQRVLALDLGRGAERVERTSGSLLRQINLLVEHRQALITAAVTGELAVPGVAV